MLATDASRIMRDQGVTAPVAEFGKEMILGKEFDSAKPDDYLRSVRKSG
jgi:nitrate/nitrite transport system substrate-binding protein